MRLGSAHFGSNAPVSWGSETAYDLAPLPSGAGPYREASIEGQRSGQSSRNSIENTEYLVREPIRQGGTWYCYPRPTPKRFCLGPVPESPSEPMSLKMLVRSRANAPRFLGAFLRTESGGRSGFDPVDLSSKPLDSFDPVVDLGETSAGRDRNPSGPGRLSVRNPPQAAVARRWRAAKDLLRGVFVGSRSGCG
jgi:hypothetical protein